MKKRVFVWPRSPVWPSDAMYVTYDPYLNASGQLDLLSGQPIHYPVSGPSSCQWMIPGTHG